LAQQGVENFEVYAAAEAYVLRLGEALHREPTRDGITVTALCPGLSNTGFATAAQQTITAALSLLMMQAAPVVRAGIRALQAGRSSVVPGRANTTTAIFVWATARWLHQAVLSRVMNAGRRSRVRSTASHAIAQVDYSGAETSRLEEFEIPSQAGSECRLSAADDHRVEKQVTFINQIGFERKSRQLGSANEDIVLRLPLELPSRLGVEVPLDMRRACRSACQRS
jgi:hypothetical protein